MKFVAPIEWSEFFAFSKKKKKIIILKNNFPKEHENILSFLEMLLNQNSSYV